MFNHYTFTEDEIHAILFALLQLGINLDQSGLIENIKDQMSQNKFKENNKVA